MRQSLTYDRGREMAERTNSPEHGHEGVFTIPGPLARGATRTNGLLRQFQGTDLSGYSQQQLDTVADDSMAATG